jgi:hypothetical protein
MASRTSVRNQRLFLMVKHAPWVHLFVVEAVLVKARRLPR